ncbi:MAG TPA: HAD-IIB family hydrolase [Myxococcaceae bacterium]|nr:HAD-IIB family hydrolase [Myxococcaceae bacterium]
MPQTRLPQPLASADLSRVQAVFTDVDGTLTSSNRLEARTLRSIEKLKQNDLRVVLVSGRPAGWGDCWLRTLPVDAVIAENGGVCLTRDRRGRFEKVYSEGSSERLRNRKRLLREVQAALSQVPGARLSTDSPYTEVNIAIDYNEEAKLSPTALRALETFLKRRGVTIARSSVHLNCWIGAFDKLSMVRRFIRESWGLRLAKPDRRFVYAGDSLNDAPMFGAFSLAVGVANVADVWSELDQRPSFVTRGREGRGFEQLAAAIIAQRKLGGQPLRAAR